MYKSVCEARRDGWKVQVCHFRKTKNGQLLFHSLIPRNELMPQGGLTILICSKNNNDIVTSFTHKQNYNKKLGIEGCLKGEAWKELSY